jgi:hypothetical protein
MAKANLDGVPETGSRWDVEGVNVTVTGFKAKGRGGYVLWDSYNSAGGKTRLSEFRSKAKAA